MKLKESVLTKTRTASRGQTFAEYSIILLSVGIAAFSAFTGLGAGVRAFASNIVTFIASAASSL